MLFGSLGISIASREDKRFFTGPMILAGLTVLACAVTRTLGLDHLGLSFCYFKSLTGYACMTCGTTRAFGHLSRFDVPGAFAIQPLVTAATLCLLVWGAIDGGLAVASKRTVLRMDKKASQRIVALVVILAALNWIYLLAKGV